MWNHDHDVLNKFAIMLVNIKLLEPWPTPPPMVDNFLAIYTKREKYELLHDR